MYANGCLVQLMAECLWSLRGRVVGVVGLAHLDGIEERWEAMQHKPPH